MKNYFLYNSLAGNGNAKAKAEQGRRFVGDAGCELMDVVEIKDWPAFFRSLESDDTLYLFGGDGTLNHFVNDIDGIDFPNPVYYYPAGTGNDFWTDLGKTVSEDTVPVQINEYLRNLPLVEVKGMKRRFLNGVGYGIDGYCCEVGDQLKQKSDKPVNYAGIAIKGLLFYYKPTLAKINVDGKDYEFKGAWLAPTMNGRFYGGGMNATPGQDRLNPERTVSTLVMYGAGKLKTLMEFPSIFKGEHIKYTDNVRILTGKNVRVTFDRPVALQIDGETVLNVTEYTVKAGK